MSSSAGHPAEGPHLESSAPVPKSASASPVAGLGSLFVAGVVLVVVVLVPPVSSLARRYVLAEALQFSVLAYAGPALLVLGLPRATRGRLGSWPALHRLAGSPVSRPTRAPGVATRRARNRFDPLEDRPGRGAFDPSAARAWAALALFVGLVVLWRSSWAVDALAHNGWLGLLEAATLLVSGFGLWLHISDSTTPVVGAGRPRKMTIAAIAMWSVWILAFIVGFSGHPMYAAYRHRAGSGLSAIGDQELAVAVLWAIPGLVLVPVVFANLVKWLRSQDLT